MPQKKRVTELLCYHCNLPGHFGKNCPTRFDVQMMSMDELQEALEDRMALLDVAPLDSSQLLEVSPEIMEDFLQDERVTCTPSLSTHNHFSILHVDSIPEIDEPVENLPVVPPKTDPLAPSCKQKPNWEKCIPNHLVIDTLDEKEGCCRSLTLKIELQTTDTGETKSMTGLWSHWDGH